MSSARLVGRIGITLSLIASVVIGAAGCLAIPVPIGGPVVVAPRPPVVVVPGHRQGYGYYRHGYGGYRHGHGGWR